MKAELDAHGKLTIRAENDLESYALKKWWESYKPDEAEGESVLEVLSVVVTPTDR